MVTVVLMVYNTTSGLMSVVNIPLPSPSFFLSPLVVHQMYTRENASAQPSKPTKPHRQFANRRTNQLVTRTIYSPDPSVGDFSICGDGDGRAWAVVEGAFTWERDPPDTATDVDGIPVFEDISFRTLEVLGRREMRDLHDDSAVLYVVADDQGVAVNVDTLGDNGFQLYTSETCANDARDHV